MTDNDVDENAAKDRPDGMKDMSTVDWTRKGPLPDLPGQRRVSERGGFGGRQFDAASDAGSERGGDRRRPPPFAGDGKERDLGNWERRGPLSPAASTGPPREGDRPRNDGPRERRQSPAWGEGQSNDGSRPPRREFQERPPVDRAPGASEMDNQWRTKMRPDAAAAKSPSATTPDASTPSSPAPQPAAPATRPRLNLAKRTVSEAPDSAAPTSASESSSKANPFGAARPIDTAAREKEIEEKKALAIRQKKEADDKAREEKKAKEAASKASAEEAASTPAGEDTKEKDAEEKPRANFEILQRVGEEGGEEVQDDAPDASANGNIVDDKAVKPKEIVRDTKTEGAWRRKSNAPSGPDAATTGEKMEDDGWSTVTKPKKDTRGNRRGGPPRAIAS
jgi:translation initiation factor 4B